ncbi:MAG: hypothetical protein C7B46_18715 [Sulfobacillus benefaciens]|uniref:Uncharacterized protein n=1 Tax=Sulfobacillus benefaciens TaxID=453960 RepID=A0A2T2X3U1_9FIRM|nr:MAG: hypothetical protein C7B46_18715 [Sulfobacillus benefaciens]
MDPNAPETTRYKPSVNIDQAPRIIVPLLFFGTAYGFIIVTAILLIFLAKPLAQGMYGLSSILVMVHCFTLGFLTMTAMGILHQWVPVVFDVPPWGTRRALASYVGYFLGVLVLVWGFAAQGWLVVAIGGSVLALSIVWWSVGVLRQLAHSAQARDVVYHGLRGAVIGLNLVWVVGLFMALSFLGWWPTYTVLRVHIATALVGWMGWLILTVQLKLNPMFSMSRAEGHTSGIPLILSAIGLGWAWLSLVSSAIAFRIGAVFWVLAVLATLRQSGEVVGHGKSKDRVFIGVASAWLLLLGASILALWLNPLAVIVAFWGLLTLILSYQSRIIPFVVAVAVAKRLPGPSFKAFFMAQAMHSKNQPIVTGLLGLAGAALSILGRTQRLPGLDEAAGFVGLFLIGTQLLNLMTAMARGRHAQPSRP